MPTGLTLADLESTPAPEGLSHTEVTPQEQEIAKQPGEQAQPAPKPEIEDTPEPVPDATAKPDAEDDEPMDINEAMNRTQKRVKEQEEAKKVEEAKAKEEEAAAKAEKPTEEAPKPERDSDLNKISLNSSAHETTRKNFNAVKKLAAAARDERDQAAAKAQAAEQRIAEYEKKVAELEQATKSGKAPKELEEKLKQYEERIRELDISKDPQLEAKYDKRIESNNKSILDVLRAQGFGQKAGPDGKMVEDAKAIADLQKSGLTLSTLKPLLNKLDEAGLADEAEAIRESIRENIRLAREKGAEIETWKGSYDQRKQAQQEQSRQQQEQSTRAVATARDAVLKRDMETLEKDLPFLKEPPQPLPTDNASVQKAKQAARDAWNAAQAKVKEELASMKTEGLAPEKFAETAGRISANAVQAAILKTHAIPALMSQLKAAQARIKELEGQTSRQRAAGELSRVHAGSGPSNPDAGKQEARTLEEAADNIAKEMNLR